MTQNEVGDIKGEEADVAINARRGNSDSDEAVLGSQFFIRKTETTLGISTERINKVIG